MSKHEEVSPVSSLQLAMTANPATVLLVEDDRTDAGLILKALGDSVSSRATPLVLSR